MKNRLVQSTVAAAALMVLGAAAGFGQTGATMAANVNFSFHVGAQVLPAGSYELSVRNSSVPAILIIRNAATGHATLTVSPYRIDPKRNTDPRLVFRCGGSTCALSEIWMDGLSLGYKAPNLRLTPGEKERIAVVSLKPPSAE